MKVFLFSFCILFFLVKLEAQENCLPVLKENNQAKDYNYLMVPGVFNEFIPFYMTRYKKHLAGLGVLSSQMKKINNFSITTPEDSSLYLKRRIESFDNDKQIIIFAHSKGALETLYMLKKYPEIRERIYKAILMQGPLQGVSSYDLTYASVGEEVSKKSLFFMAYRAIAKLSFISLRFQNFARKKVTQDLNYEVLEKENLLEKIIFVRSYKKVKDMNWRMRYLGGLYRDYLKEKSDGVILWKEQLPKGVTPENACVVDEYADHGEFATTSMIKRKQKIRKIRAFINSILYGLKQAVINLEKI